MSSSSFELEFDVAPWRLSGVVYGALLNHKPALQALGDAVGQPPYKAAPVAPVLYVKPRNTLARDGDRVVVPSDVSELEIGATLGIVIAKPSCRLSLKNALEHVAGYTIVNDLSVPHASFYRPSIPMKARDGFCTIGPRVVPVNEVSQHYALSVKVYVDGVLKQNTTTGERLRSVAQLIVDVTEFMTLQAGDVLMLGPSYGAPRATAGQHVAIEIEKLGRLANSLVFEGSEKHDGARA